MFLSSKQKLLNLPAYSLWSLAIQTSMLTSYQVQNECSVKMLSVMFIKTKKLASPSPAGLFD